MKSRKVLVVDYGSGNINSVVRAIARTEVGSVEKGLCGNFSSYDGLVLPGVGSYGEVISNLGMSEKIGAIKDFIKTGKPVLGICLGMQLLFDGSAESPSTAGLKYFKGNCEAFDLDLVSRKTHIGWKALNREISKDSSGAPDWFGEISGKYFYFVHSYFIPTSIHGFYGLTTSFEQQSLTAAVWRENVTGFQFHPEKSADNGLNLLAAYFQHCWD